MLLRCRFAEKLSERYFRMVEGMQQRGAASQHDNQDTSASEDLLSMEE